MISLILFFIQGSISTTFFTTRPFLTVFGFAALARSSLSVWGGDAIARLAPAGTSLTGYGNAEMPLLLSNELLFVLGALALLEYLAFSSDTWRFVYNHVLWLIQPGSTFAVTYTFGNTEFALLTERIAKLLPAASVAVAAMGGAAPDDASAALQLGESLVWIGHALAAAWAALLAAVTWFLGRMRAEVIEIVDDLDEDNDLGLQSLIHWAETGWTAIGALVLFVLPSVALLMAGATIATMFILRKYFEHREQNSYVACTHCAAMGHPSAPFCPSCATPRDEVRAIGMFGQARDALAPDRTAHRFQLLARKRCPRCAARLRAKSLQQTCESCGTVTFASISDANTFIRTVDAKVGQTTLVVFICGLIPLIGLVPALIYFRLSLISSLRSYLPRGTGCLTRWAVRILNICLVMLQSIPGLGALALPAMCLSNYWVYRLVFSGSAQGVLSSPAPTIDHACPNCGAPDQITRRFCTQCGGQIQSA